MTDPLWEVGAKAIDTHRDGGRGDGWERDDETWRKWTPFAEWVLAAVEPLIRADERDRVRHWGPRCRQCGVVHDYDGYTGEHRAHQRTTGMAPATGYMCVCGRWVMGLDEWHDHLTGADGG